MAFTLRLPDHVDAALRVAAARDNLSLNDAVIKAIEAYVSDRDARRDAHLRRIVDRDGSLLRRLGEGA